MKFELSVALKYLIPRWRQLSVSIISLISILVVSLVVWLAIVFLSISEGIQERWVEGFVTLNAPVKVTPKEAYFNSYYHQIDRYSLASNYSTKSIAEKRMAKVSDPYDPMVDRELPTAMLKPEKMQDLVKEAWSSVESLDFKGIRPQEAQVSLCNLKLRLNDSFLSQLCYVTGHDESNARMKKRVLPPTAQDVTHFLNTIPGGKEAFFSSVNVHALQTADYEFELGHDFVPAASLMGCKVFFPSGEQKVIIPSSKAKLDELLSYLGGIGFKVEEVKVDFNGKEVSEKCEITLDRAIPLQATLIDPKSGQFELKGEVQGVEISGKSSTDHLEVMHADIRPGKSYWVYENAVGLTIPEDRGLGDGILLSSGYQDKGVKLGDRGYLSFMTGTSTSVQEQKTPVYVAGFFDPGIVPMAGKLLFVSPILMRTFDGNLSLPDEMFANGINVWLDHPKDAVVVKEALEAELQKRGIADYWHVESFYDFEFARPILQQFDSDKTLFTLIAIMILVVACSNIISMLILLVNDKKREIGILQSLGASPKRIGMIFGMCGLFTGLLSCLFGAVLAVLTLKNLGPLVQFLNFLKGHELFQKMFFGGDLPNTVSVSALIFVLSATVVISVLAGLVPALKASRIRPSEILRREA